MENTNQADICDLRGLIKNLRMMAQNLHRVTATQPVQQIENNVPLLEEIVSRAEQEKNVDLLKMLCDYLVPELGAVENAYQVTGRNFLKIDYQLQEAEKVISSFLPNSMVHVAADTIANAGDYILVRSLKKLIENDKKDINWITVDVRKDINENFIAMCNRSDGIVIGGGGFFLKDTNPNEISGWQWPCSISDMRRIEKPIYVMGVGYNRFRGQGEFNDCFKDNINALVEKSEFFGLRNYGSIRAIQNYLRDDLKEKVVYHPCATTVLSKLYNIPERTGEEPYIALNCAFDRANLRYQDKQDEIMLALARVLKQLSERYKIKCYIHCQNDEIVCRYLDFVQVPYERVVLMKEMTQEEYVKYFSEPELVLAVRGHAQMIPFGCKTPVVSLISHDKLKWFLEDIGHPEWGVEVLDAQFEEKLWAVSQYMLQNREKICEEIEEAQNKLWQIMQDNLKLMTI